MNAERTWWEDELALTFVERALDAIDEAGPDARGEAQRRAYAKALELLREASELVGVAASTDDDGRDPEAVVAAVLDLQPTRLACYGTLRTGESNRHVLGAIPDGLPATIPGVVGEYGGWPSLHRQSWSQPVPLVPLEVFDAPEIADMWPALDAFEGDAYRRRWVLARLEGGRFVIAQIYDRAPHLDRRSRA